ncbi:MAG TPA: hypothetical protein VLA98_11175 [Solirubrobacteraceae bacterium]|nr:hypothetical protein [Solirubrobacteraceae bacterium]
MSATTRRTPQEVFQHHAAPLGAEARVGDGIDTFVVGDGLIRVPTVRDTPAPTGRS